MNLEVLTYGTLANGGVTEHNIYLSISEGSDSLSTISSSSCVVTKYGSSEKITVSTSSTKTIYTPGYYTATLTTYDKAGNSASRTYTFYRKPYSTTGTTPRGSHTTNLSNIYNVGTNLLTSYYTMPRYNPYTLGQSFYFANNIDTSYKGKYLRGVYICMNVPSAVGTLSLTLTPTGSSSTYSGSYAPSESGNWKYIAVGASNCSGLSLRISGGLSYSDTYIYGVIPVVDKYALLGDVNLDGSRNVSDMEAYTKYFADMLSGTALTTFQNNADLDFDGSITVLDQEIMQKLIRGTY